MSSNMECDRDEAFAYLIGALGDGTLYTTSDGHYVVEYGQKDIRWLKVIEQKVGCLGYTTHIIKHKSRYWKAKIYSKELYTALSEVKSRLRDVITALDARLFVAYLRGLFDAEGTITRHYRKTVRIRIAQKDAELLAIVAKRLRELGIDSTDPFPSDKHGTYVIQIPHRSVKQFMNLVGTEHPSKKEKFTSLIS